MWDLNSLTRDQTCVPCIGRQILNHWTTREVKRSETLSHVWLFVTPMELWPARLLCPWNSPGKNTGVGSHSLPQGIFPIQGSNPGLPHCRRSLYRPSHQGSPHQGSPYHMIFEASLVFPFICLHSASSLLTPPWCVTVSCEPTAVLPALPEFDDPSLIYCN